VSLGAAPLLLAAAALLSIQSPPPGAGAHTSGDGFQIGGRLEQGGFARGKVPPGAVRLLLDGKPVEVASDGSFLIGFDRDQGPAAELRTELPGGATAVRRLAVAPRRWRTERVSVARRPSQSEDFLRRRGLELARIEAARSRNSGSEGWRQSFIWPAKGRISGVFGSQRIYRGEPGAYHNGLDVAAGAGAPVVAPADGTVMLAGPPAFSLEGNLVIIDHGMGLNSAFLHFADTKVREGERVRQGQPIGTVGASGRATGPHLHWSMKWRDARIDPHNWVGNRASEGLGQGL